MDERFRVFGTAREATGGEYPGGIGECHSLLSPVDDSREVRRVGRGVLGGSAVAVEQKNLGNVVDDAPVGGLAAGDHIPAEVGEEPEDVEPGQVDAPPVDEQDGRALAPLKDPEQEAEGGDP